jgi:hypothetical protein
VLLLSLKPALAAFIELAVRRHDEWSLDRAGDGGLPAGATLVIVRHLRSISARWSHR